MDKVDSLIQKLIAEFEKKPVATTIKGLIVLWILNKALQWFKN